MNGFLNDLRLGVRQLAAKPGFAAAAILTLALGIGANTAVFSFLSGYLLKPLPYPHASRLVQVNMRFPKVSAKPVNLSLPLYHVIDQHVDAFDATAFYIRGSFNLNAGGRARHVFATSTSASLFDVLGVQPLLGRTFTADNMHPGSNHVAVISYALWRNVFGADRDIIGKTVRLSHPRWFNPKTPDNGYRIIGVMPEGFAFPNHNAALWLPYALLPSTFSPSGVFDKNRAFIGRLKPGITLDAAKARIQHAASTYIQEKVPTKLQKMARRTGFAVGIERWHDVLLGDRPATLWLLQGAVLLILLITCVNVANLLLSRILGRSHEMAMRSALGATRAVLARQLMGEALCLTVPGGLVGIALCWLALHWLTGSALGAGDSVFNIALDWRVGLFALGVVLFTAALVSVLPIRQLAKQTCNSFCRKAVEPRAGDAAQNGCETRS